MPFGDPLWNQPRTHSNPRLLRALAGNPRDELARKQLYDALLNSTLVVPTHQRVQPMPRAGDLLLVEDEQGSNSIPAFTDLHAMHRWMPQTAFVTLPLAELLHNLPSEAAGIWLNIADRGSRFVSRAELAQITGGLVTTTVVEAQRRDVAPPGTTLNYRVPSSLPGGLVATVRATLSVEPDITEGYLVLVSRQGKRSRLALMVRLSRLLDDGPLDALMARVQAKINVNRRRRPAIHCLPLDHATHALIARILPPMYERPAPAPSTDWAAW